jgi:hypothetical protein
VFSTVITELTVSLIRKKIEIMFFDNIPKVKELLL